MRRTRVAWCGGLLAAVALAGRTSGGEEIPPQPVSGKIRWLYNYDEGKAEARRTGKPMFVVFRCER